jgi:uncharacterized protein involved in outer membrane biogenesis
MKKWVIGIAVVLVVLLIGIVVAVSLTLDSAVKKGVETVGPMVTKTSVKLDGVSLSILSGSGTVKGLVIGNPEGFKTASAMQVGSAHLAVVPSSLFGDKIVVRKINVEGPEITFETDLRKSNLSQLIENLQAAAGPSDPNAKEPEAASASRKLQVDEFLVTGGKINVSLTKLAGKTVTVPLPEIRLTNLGSGPEGITAAELTKAMLKKVNEEAIRASAEAVADLGKQAVGLATETATEAAGEAVNKATKGIGDLFKKKK